ncbi:MAG: sensor histidine kinase [Bacteroidota bacterium]|jgi:two-component system NarL family sensor kinase
MPTYKASKLIAIGFIVRSLFVFGVEDKLPQPINYSSQTGKCTTDSLIFLCRYYVGRDFTISRRYGRAAMVEAKKNGDVFSLANAMRWVAFTHYLEEQYLDSNGYYQHLAMRILEKEKSAACRGLYLLIKTLSAQGTGIETSDKNIVSLQHAYLYGIRSGNTCLQADVLDRLAHAYWQKGYDTQKNAYYRKAVANWQAAIKLYKSLQYSENVIGEKSKIATTYIILGKIKQADQLLAECLEENRKVGNLLGIGACLMNIGDSYFEKKQFHTSIHYYKESCRLYHKIGFAGGYGWGNMQLEKAYEAIGDYRNAHHQAKIRIENLHKTLDNKNRLQVYKLRETYNKRLQNRMVSQYRAETMLAAEEIKNTRKQLIMMVILLMVFAAGGMLLYQLNRRKQESRVMEALLTGEEEERKRLSHRLHDSLGGLLSAIKTLSEGLLYAEGNERTEKLKTIDAMIATAASEVRDMSHSLMPAMLTEFGLEIILKDFFEKLNQSDTICFHLDYDTKGILLSEKTQLQLYYILLELVQNILRHSSAEKAYFSIFENNNHFYLLAEDDGKGFDQLKSVKGLGIRNMINRVKLLKGILQIDSVPGKGTTVHIEFPIDNLI